MGLDRVLEAVRDAGMTPAELLALAGLLAGAVALSGVVLLTGTGPAAEPDRPVPAVTNGPLDVASEVVTPGTVVVDVAGLVASPGLVELQVGSRVADAVAAAGGPTSQGDTSTLNLARVLVDGEQIVVGDDTQPMSSTGSGGGPTAVLPDGRISLNAATAEDLQGLPGVGPVTAERILAHRDEIGGFSDLVQLLEVPGIGPARFADLEGRVAL